MSLNLLPFHIILVITILALCLIATASPTALAPLAVPGGQNNFPLVPRAAYIRRSSNDALLDIDIILGLGTEYGKQDQKVYDHDRGHQNHDQDHDHDEDRDHDHDHKHTHEHIHTHNHRMTPRHRHAIR